MSKTNNKKNRTDGSITSANMKFPDPITSKNTPTSTYDYTELERIEQNTVENQKR